MPFIISIFDTVVVMMHGDIDPIRMANVHIYKYFSIAEVNTSGFGAHRQTVNGME